MEQVHLKQKRLPFALIKPVQTQPRENLYIVLPGTSTRLEEIKHWWTEAKGPLVVDLETNGTQAHDPNQYVVGVSFADERGAIYVDVSNAQDLWKAILVELYKHKTPLIAHNVAFDASWMTRDLITALGGWENTSWLDSDNMYTKWTYHNWYVCTYAAYKHLASEGWENQKWGLKDLQVQVLNWESRGDVEIEAWLVENGHTKGQGSKKKADKGEMWRVPCSILGKYGCADTDSTWQFWEYVLKPLFERFSTYKWYHHEPFMSCVTMHMRQQLSGMQLDRKQLEIAQKVVSTRRDATLEEFFTHEKVVPLIREWNDQFIYESADKEPPKHKVVKLGEEPPRFKKNGEESPVWRKWKEKEAKADNPEVSGRWLQWEAKHQEVRATQHFNLGSPVQLRWMFYDKLGFDPIVYTKGENPQPSTGKDALIGFGELGKILKRYKDDVKLLQMIDAYLSNADSKDVLRVQLKIPGTLSGRLSGG